MEKNSTTVPSNVMNSKCFRAVVWRNNLMFRCMPYLLLCYWLYKAPSGPRHFTHWQTCLLHWMPWEKKNQAKKKKNSACLPNLSLAIFYILERKMKLTVWKNVLVFFFQSSEKQLWSLLKPIAPSNVTSCLLQCFLRSQVATKPLWSRYKSHTITTGKNALWGKKKTELEMTM